MLPPFSGAVKVSVKIIDVPAEISTEHLPNASLERYRYTSQLRT
jgi:hypothetical protein